MTLPAGLIDHPVVQALAWALVHFVWQGALIGLATVALLRLFRFAPPTRYAIGVFALAAMAAAPAVTFGLSVGSIAPQAQAASAPAVALAVPPMTAPIDGTVVIDSLTPTDAGGTPALAERASWFAPVVLAVWLVGVVTLSVRLLGGWLVARRLTRRAVRPASADLQSLGQRIAGRLALDRVVSILESSAVAVPMLIGWLRPVVLLPAAALSGLTPTQVEALLAHELAHIRRHDYLVNLLQSVVETLLFYHPAVWWVSRQVCTEREHCCDDLAVGVCDRLEYVTALAYLAAMTALPRPALAATDGSLVTRVRRLLSPGDDHQASRAPGWMAASAIVLGVVGATAFMPTAHGSSAEAGQTPVVVWPVGPPPATAALPGTAPEPAAVEPLGVAEDLPRAVPGEAPPSGRPGGLVTPVPVADPQTPPPPPPPPTPVRVAPPTPPMPPAPARVPLAGPVPAVPPTDAPPTPPAPPAPAQDPERVRAMREAERELRAVQREVEMKRLELEMQQAKVQAEAQLESAQAQMESLRKQIEKTRQMVDVGLATPEAQAALEKELAMATQQLKITESELSLRQSDIELRRREAMARAEYAERLAELEVARRATEAVDVRSVTEAAMRDRQAVVEAREQAVAAVRAGDVERSREVAEVERRLAELRASGRPDPDAERFLEQQLAEIRGGLAGSTVPVSRTEPARAGDVLTLTVAGEPTLPSRYTVLRDGTIRLPFVGNVSVQGMTADQIRDAVARQLTERNLKTNPTVTVEIRRPAR